MAASKRLKEANEDLDASPHTRYGLTHRQYIFATELLKGASATQAATIAFDIADTSTSTAATVGHEYQRKPNVAKYIEDERKRIAKRNESTADEWLNAIRDAITIAKQTQNASALSSAAFNGAKLTGDVVDRSEDVTKRTPTETIDKLIESDALPIILARAVELGKLVSYELP